MNTHLIGKDVNRVDGPAKVSGAAKYAAEFFAPEMLYAVAVSSTIARGEIAFIETTAALRVQGAVEAFTHKNRPDLPWFDKAYLDEDAPKDGSPLRPLYGAKIEFSGQPIALCVAETFEAARAMSRLVSVTYSSLAHQTDMTIGIADAKAIKKSNRDGIEPPPKPRGEFAQAFADASVKLVKEYSSPTEIHNPIELFATTVVYNDDDTLTIYDKTQSVSNSQKYVCQIFGYSTRTRAMRRHRITLVHVRDTDPIDLNATTRLVILNELQECWVEACRSLMGRFHSRQACPSCVSLS